MVNEEHKHVVFDRASEYFATTGSFLVTHHDCHKGLSIELVSGIVEHIRVVDVVAIRVVKNLALEWVLFCCSDVITGHKDDLLWIKSLFDKQLVGMMRISLVTIVVVATTTRNDHSPVLFRLCCLKQGCSEYAPTCHEPLH